MLSFELSAVDLVLFIAIIVLFLLYLRFSTRFDWLNQKKRLQHSETVVDETAKKYEIKDEKKREIVVPLISGKCPFNFGYLRKLSDEVSIPTECLECSRILECRYEIISESE
jgi:ferredoxin-like protein FixX